MALVVGWVIDVGGSNAVGLIYFLWAMATGRMDPGMVTDPNALMRDPDTLQVMFVTGFAVSIVAGYVAARIAGRAHLLHGLLASAAGVVIGIFTLGMTLQTQPAAWLVAAPFVAGPAAGTLGGYLALRQAGRSAENADAVP